MHTVQMECEFCAWFTRNGCLKGFNPANGTCKRTAEELDAFNYLREDAEKHGTDNAFTRELFDNYALEYAIKQVLFANGQRELARREIVDGEEVVLLLDTTDCIREGIPQIRRIARNIKKNDILCIGEFSKRHKDYRCVISVTEEGYWGMIMPKKDGQVPVEVKAVSLPLLREKYINAVDTLEAS